MVSGPSSHLLMERVSKLLAHLIAFIMPFQLSRLKVIPAIWNSFSLLFLERFGIKPWMIGEFRPGFWERGLLPIDEVLLFFFRFIRGSVAFGALFLSKKSSNSCISNSYY